MVPLVPRGPKRRSRWSVDAHTRMLRFAVEVLDYPRTVLVGSGTEGWAGRRLRTADPQPPSVQWRGAAVAAACGEQGPAIGAGGRPQAVPRFSGSSDGRSSRWGRRGRPGCAATAPSTGWPSREQWGRARRRAAGPARCAPRRVPADSLAAATIDQAELVLLPFLEKPVSSVIRTPSGVPSHSATYCCRSSRTASASRDSPFSPGAPRASQPAGGPERRRPAAPG